MVLLSSLALCSSAASLETMTAPDFFVSFKATISASGSGHFARLTDGAVKTHFEELAEAVLDNDTVSAENTISALDALGVDYKLVQITDLSEPVLGFMEDSLPGDADYKGWGAVLIRHGSPGYTIYQAPHVVADMYSEDIAFEAFQDNPNALMIQFAGTHRNASGDNDGDGKNDSDVAHDTENLFHILTDYMAQRGQAFGTAYWFLQIHGASNRTSEPTIVASTGADSPTLTAADAIVEIDDDVDTAGHVSMGVEGWPEGPNDDEDGDYYLKATTNVQGDHLESLGLRYSFMHFEIERHARDDYIAGSGPGFDGIQSLLTAIATTLGTEHGTVPVELATFAIE